MTNTMEIERKFLVHETPELERVMHQRLRQGYIATDSTEVRVRKAGDQCTLTCKRGSGLVRLEEEIGISQAQFHSLWSMLLEQLLQYFMLITRKEVHNAESTAIHWNKSSHNIIWTWCIQLGSH